jgi:alcohol dehydrogenase class IV
VALQAAGLTVETYDEIAGEPSIETLELCRAAMRLGPFNLVIALGGGSALDTAKAAAALTRSAGPAAQFLGRNLIPQPGLPVIAVPTTAGTASEVTPNAVFADLAAGVKKAMMSPHLMPKVALVDPELTYSVPPAITAATGMDALAHAIEAYVSPNATLLTQTHGIKAMELIGANLRRAVAVGGDAPAREAMAWGSLLAGLSFANAGVGAVHALAYPLGGKYHVPHGVANAMLLARVMRFEAPATPARFAAMARALGAEVRDASEEALAAAGVDAMQRLAADAGIPQRLRDIGIPQDALDPMAIEASKIERLLLNSARMMSLDDIRAVYYDIW